MQRLFASLIATFSYKTILSLCLVLTLILSAFPFARSVYALTFQLSGKVTDESSNPIGGTIVDVFNTGTSIVVASDTTDINGDYNLAISDGIYDIQVTPPAGSGFQIATVTNIEVSSDTVLNFSLVPITIPLPFTVSGTVTDRAGTGAGGIEVELGYNSTRLIGTTDSSGFYSILVPSGAQTQDGFDGKVALRANNPPSQYFPRTLRLLTQDSFVFTQDTTLDIQIPGNLLTVHVQDPSQNPVANARVDIFPSNDGSPFPVQTSLGIIQFAPNDSIHPEGGTAFSTSYTDNTGSITQAYFPIGINLNVVPPDLNVLQHDETQLSLIQDTSITVTLLSAISPFTVSGTVTDRTGTGAGGIEVELGYNSTRLIGTTDSSGFYSILVPSNAQTQDGFDGQVALRANNPTSQYLPSTLRLLTQDSLNFTQDITLDIQIPGNLLTVHVQDPSQNPVANARVDIFPSNDGSPFPVQTSLGIIQFAPNDSIHPSGGTSFSLDYTDNTGSVTQAYFPVSVNLNIVPPDLNVLQHLETQLLLTQDTSITVTLLSAISPFTVSGTVIDRSGIGVGGITVELGYWSPRLIDTTDSSGFYSIQVPPENQTQDGFDAQIALRVDNPNSQYLPRTLRLLTQDSVHFNQDTTLNIQIPGNLLTVHVQDPSQNPVVNARVDIFPSNDGSSFPVQTSLGRIQFAPNDNLHPEGGTAFSTSYTDNTGIITQAYFPVDVNLKVVPPDLNVYQLFETQLFLNSDITQIIVFQFVHDPPITNASLTPSPYPFGEYYDPTIVTLSATAYTGFTIDATYYQVNGDATQTYLTPFEVSGNGNHTIAFWSVDNAGVFEAPKEETFIIHTNLAPTTDADGPHLVSEGDQVLLSAVSNDPENGPLAYAWDLDNNGSFETFGQSVNFSAATLDGPSSYTIAVQVTDDGNLTATDQAAVNVLNVAPTVGTITAPTDPVLVNTAIITSAGFIDPGTPDTHTAAWDWGDGTSAGLVDQVLNTVTGTHSYSTPGVYEVKATVTDDDLDSGESIYQFVVVYDSSASGGFVTGAGTIFSPAGAYTSNSSLSGIANFGFVSKYQPGATTPSGDTQFRFQVAQFAFSSSVYDWLVVAGPQAKFKGVGTVNGAGNYGFQLSATDGAINGGGGVDKFRIKIWDKDNNDNVVYDNQLGASDNANPTTAIQGGNIVIH